MQPLLCSLALRLTERRIRGKFIFIQYKWFTRRINPYIQQQIDLLYVIIVDGCWLCDVAVPAFSCAVCCDNIEDIIPSPGVIVFYKPVSRFKTRVAQISCCKRPVSLNDHPIRNLFDNLARVCYLDFPQRIQFDDCNHVSI